MKHLAVSVCVFIFQAALAAQLSLPTTAVRGVASPLQFHSESSHYDVSSNVSLQACADATVLLEQAWPIWRQRFKEIARPREGALRMSVKIFKDKESYAAAIKSEVGVKMGDEAGRCDWRTGNVYALHNALPYERRRVLLHEGTHQFQYLSLPLGKSDPFPFWYLEGTAHDCERYILNESGLTMMLPDSPHTADFAVEALESTSKRMWRMDAYLERGGYAKGVEERPMGWALVRFFRLADGGRYRPWFEQLEERFCRRQNRIGFIKESPWTEKALEQAFITWVRGKILLSGVIRGEWSGKGNTHIASYVPHLLCLKVLEPQSAPGQRLRLAYTPSRRLGASEQAGFVIGYRSPFEYTLVWFDEHRNLRITPRVKNAYKANRKWKYDAAPPGPGDRVVMDLDSVGKLSLTLRGTPLLSNPIETGILEGGAGLYAGIHKRPKGSSQPRWTPWQYVFGEVAHNRTSLKLELKLHDGPHAQGGPISAHVKLTNSSGQKVRLALDSDRISSFDGTLADAVRLIVVDAQGKRHGIGEFGNYNRGPDRIHLEIPATGTLEGKVSTFLGHLLAKGNVRKNLPVGSYTLHAVLGDIPVWLSEDEAGKRIQSNSVPLKIVAAQKLLRVADLAWLSGKWTGRQRNAVFEETWSAPAAGSMLGTFRWMEKDKSRFFEFLLMEEDAKGVVLRFKHFSPGYRPWEKKGPVELRASQPEKGRMVLTNTSKQTNPKRMVYAKTGDDTLKVTIESQGRDGKPETLELHFSRSR